MSKVDARRKAPRTRDRAAGARSGSTNTPKSKPAANRFVGALRALSTADLVDLVELAAELRRVDSTGDAQMRSEIEEAIVEILSLPKSGGRTVAPPPLGARPAKLQRWIDSVADAVRKQRERRRWTQQELADRSGLPQSHISRIERGVLSPSHKTVNRLAEALKVSIGEIDPSAPSD